MRVILYYNPRAGTGRAEREAEGLARRLRDAGHEPMLLPSRSGVLPWPDAQALVVLGGDGTVQSVLDHALAARTAIYHFPLGTENLFAREFGMNRRPETLIAALDCGRVREVDVGRCNGRAFSIMCGIGPDAGVVHRLASRRKGPISHASYAPAVLAELVSPSLAAISVQVDGHAAVEGVAGWLVVANSRRYALRQDPAIAADMSDGLLDVAFFPARSSSKVVAWMILARMRLQRHFRSHVCARGRVIRVECHAKPLPVQLDGDSIEARAGAGANGLTISLDPRRLRVLLPPSQE